MTGATNGKESQTEQDCHDEILNDRRLRLLNQTALSLPLLRDGCGQRVEASPRESEWSRQKPDQSVRFRHDFEYQRTELEKMVYQRNCNSLNRKLHLEKLFPDENRAEKVRGHFVAG